MLHVDERAPRTPRLPRRRFSGLAQLAASGTLHVTLAAMAFWIGTASGRDVEWKGERPIVEERLPPIVFLAPVSSAVAQGGGGGGNRQPAPIRRAQGIGADAITLRTIKTPKTVQLKPVTTPANEAAPLPSIVLDAKPLASGLFEQTGLPAGVLVIGTSTGPGSGGGAGTGIGTGVGSGGGPGLGPGTGGGTGGGAYVPGGLVSAPRLILEVKARYTPEALRNKIQGTVMLEAVVTGDGCISQIRVVRSLDPGGLDDEAVAAVAQWRFDPGRRKGLPVDVLVTIMVDFTLR